MLVPLVPIHRYTSVCMPPSTSEDTSPPAVAAAAGLRSVSPKRKYSEAMTIRERLPILNVDVSDIASDSYHLSEGKCDSPRSKVAERLEALEIDHAEDAPRKRVKKTVDHEPGLRIAGSDVTPKQLPRARFALDQHMPGAVLEIAETPGCKAEAIQSTTPSPTARQAEPMKPNHTSPIVKITPKRMRSPPPPAMASPSPPAKSIHRPGTSPHSSQDSTDPADTTWQDSEITGHEIHAALGDDGEGINGIGFRPTPAIAQARSQKRRHQLSEWRAREAKEARQRRYEKRQGCSATANGDDDSHQRRVVRFEEIG